MDKITKHRISVYGINGCHDAMESNLVEVTQVYVCLLYTSPSPRDPE